MQSVQAEQLENHHVDVIVVGSGPAGSVLSQELVSRGARVLVLERGSNHRVDGTLGQMAAIAGIPGIGSFFSSDGMLVVRGIAVGGSSLLNYATAHEPPEWLKTRYHIDLQTSVNALKEKLPFGPLPDHLVGPMASVITNAACKLGLNWQKLDKLIDPNLCRPGCWRCTYGCPYGAKWHGGMAVQQAVDKGAYLLTNVQVEQVTHQPKLNVKCRIKHQYYNFCADNVVLCAGGLGSPPILNASGIQCGTQLFLDPVVAVMGSIDKLSLQPGQSAGNEVPMAAGCQHPDGHYMLSDLALPKALFRAFTCQVGRLDYWFKHHRTLSLMVKGRDGLKGNVGRKGRPIKKLQSSDWQHLQEGIDQAKDILATAGANHIFSTARFAAHPGGSAAIGQVVDHNLETKHRGL